MAKVEYTADEVSLMGSAIDAKIQSLKVSQKRAREPELKAVFEATVNRYTALKVKLSSP